MLLVQKEWEKGMSKGDKACVVGGKLGLEEAQVDLFRLAEIENSLRARVQKNIIEIRIRCCQSVQLCWSILALGSARERTLIQNRG